MATAGGSSQETDRFSDLLNPIRDLAKNWDVDIAFRLEEYMNELEMIVITFDDGKTSLNFAQAALLIQGSACVYSKKVDFLYNLVMQLLDVFRSKKAQQVTVHQAIIANQNNSDSEQFLELEDESFTKVIDFNEEENSFGTLSSLLPKIPSGIFSHKKDDKRNVILDTVNDEMLGKRNDFFLNSMELVASGAALRDGVDAFNVDVSSLIPRLPIINSAERERRLSSPDVENDFDVVDNDFHPEIDDSLPEYVTEPKLDESSPLHTYNLRKKMPSPMSAIEKALQILKKVDSHKDIESKRKPAIIAPRRTLRILKTLENNQSLRETRVTRQRRIKKVNVKRAILPALKFCDEELFSNASKFSKETCKKLACSSLHDKYFEEYKRRKNILQDIREKLKNGFVGPDENENGNENDDDTDVDMDFGGDVNDDLIDVEEDDPDYCDNIEINNNDRTSNVDLNTTITFEELIRKHTEDFITSTNAHARISSISKKVKVWEESLSPILDDEDTRMVYDMCDYSTRVLEKFAPNNRKQTMSFSKIVSGQPRYEVARLFLASLQLANNYNIDIHCEGDDLQRINQMDVTLLSHRQCFDRLEI